MYFSTIRFSDINNSNSFFENTLQEDLGAEIRKITVADSDKVVCVRTFNVRRLGQNTRPGVTRTSRLPWLILTKCYVSAHCMFRGSDKKLGRV